MSDRELIDPIADALGTFWNAALDATRRHEDSTANAVMAGMVEGVEAVASRLREHAAAATARLAEQPLGRFGRHPDAGTDFEVEVEALQGRLFNSQHGIPNDAGQVETIAQVREAIASAMSFRVGGEPRCVRAKQILRALESEAAEQPAQGAQAGEHADALQLAANRLRRLSLECGFGTSIRMDAEAWASEAESAIAALRQPSEGWGPSHKQPWHEYEDATPPRPEPSAGVRQRARELLAAECPNEAGGILKLPMEQIRYDLRVALRAIESALQQAQQSNGDDLAEQWRRGYERGVNDALPAVAQGAVGTMTVWPDGSITMPVPPPDFAPGEYALYAGSPPALTVSEEDTKRLDWLALHPRGADIVVDGQAEPCVFWGVSAAPEWTLRQAIDAAMAARQGCAK